MLAPANSVTFTGSAVLTEAKTGNR